MNAGPSDFTLSSELDRKATGHEPSRWGVSGVLCSMCSALSDGARNSVHTLISCSGMCGRTCVARARGM